MSASSVLTGVSEYSARLMVRLTSKHRQSRLADAGWGVLAVGVLPLFEWPLAGLDHGAHLLLMLIVVIGVSLRWGPRGAAFILGIGSLGCLAAALSTPELPQLTSIGLLLLLYLAAGAAYLVALSGAIRLLDARPPLQTGVVGTTGLVEQLTPRELDTLRLAAHGMNLGEIAAQLFLSPNTVKTHLAHAYGKLGASNRQDAIRLAIHYGCLDFSEICPHRVTGPA